MRGPIIHAFAQRRSSGCRPRETHGIPPESPPSSRATQGARLCIGAGDNRCRGRIPPRDPARGGAWPRCDARGGRLLWTTILAGPQDRNIYGISLDITRLLAERHRGATIPRSDALRRPSGPPPSRGRGASRNAFPRSAWERVQTLLLQCVMSGGRWCSPRSVEFCDNQGRAYAALGLRADQLMVLWSLAKWAADNGLPPPASG